MDKGRNRQEDSGGGRTGPENQRGEGAARAKAGPTPENTLTLVRDYKGTGATLGVIGFGDGRFIQTLELPWKNNERNVSCVPVGTYRCRINAERQLIHVFDVPGREGIQIHVGNYPKDTHGCILPGSYRDGEAVMESMKALNLLFRVLASRKLKESDFYLEIRECFYQRAEVRLD